MKICIIGDLHFGKNNDYDSLIDKKILQSIKNILVHIKDENIKNVVQLGDIFNNKKSINVLSGNYVLSYFREFVNNEINLYQIIGNHDCFYNHTELNSPSLLTKYNGNNYIKIINNQYIYEEFGFVSWNPKFSDNLNTKYLFGHFDIIGFEMRKNIEAKKGINPNFLSNYEIVFSGHYHRKSEKKNIIYTGSLLDLEFCDSDIEHGYYILNTDNNKIEFIQNNIKLYEKIIYNENNNEKYDVKDKLVRIICRENVNQIKLNNFKNNLLEKGAIEIKIIDISKNNEINMNAEKYEIENLDKIAENYIKEIELSDDMNIDNLLRLFVKFHKEAEEK